MNKHEIPHNELVEIIKNIDEIDEVKLHAAPRKDFELSPEGVNELHKRMAAFKGGKLSARPWNEIKKDFGPI
jgi:hypothetical protein